MKKKLLVLLFTLLCSNLFSQNTEYTDKINQGIEFEREGKYIHALSSYYDAMLLEPNSKGKTALNKYEKLANLIKSGNPTGRELDDFDMHDLWKNMQIEFETFWFKNCAFQFYVVLENQNISVYDKPLPFFLESHNLVEEGYHNARNKDWNDLESNWPRSASLQTSYNYTSVKGEIHGNIWSYCAYYYLKSSVGGLNYCLTVALVDTDTDQILDIKKINSRGNDHFYYDSKKYLNLKPVVQNVCLVIENKSVIDYSSFYAITNNEKKVYISDPKSRILNPVKKQSKEEKEEKEELRKQLSKEFKMVNFEGRYFPKFVNKWDPPKNTFCPKFSISKTQVTQKLFESVMGYNPSTFATSEYYPVDSIKKDDVFVFCNKLSLLYGYKPVYYFDNDGNPDNWTYETARNDNKYLSGVFYINEKANGFRLPTELEMEFLKDTKYTMSFKQAIGLEKDEEKETYIGDKYKRLNVYELNPNKNNICFNNLNEYYQYTKGSEYNIEKSKNTSFRIARWIPEKKENK